MNLASHVNPAFRSVTHSRLPYVSFRVKPYGFSLTLHYKINPVTFRYDTPADSRFLRLLSMEHTNIVLSFAIFVSYSGFVLTINAIVHACEMLSSYILSQNKKTIYTIYFLWTTLTIQKNYLYLSRHLRCLPTHGASEIRFTLNAINFTLTKAWQQPFLLCRTIGIT